MVVVNEDNEGYDVNLTTDIIEDFFSTGRNGRSSDTYLGLV